MNEDYAAFLDTKLSLTEVGMIGSVFRIAGIIGNISGGFLFDKFGTAKSMAYAGCMYILSILMMIFISFQSYGSSISKAAGIGYAIFCGLAVFSYTCQAQPSWQKTSLVQEIKVSCLDTLV